VSTAPSTLSPLKTATTADGAQIAYHVRGEGPGRIALTHSLAMDHRFWDRVTAELAGAGQVLVWDCRGHGASSKPAGPYTCEGFADDLAAVLDAEGWTRTAVAGASMGGSVTIAFCGRHAERVSGVGLIDTTAWYGPTAPVDWEERAGKARTNGLPSLVGFQKSRWFSEGFREAHPEVVEAAVQVFNANDVDAYVETCRMLGRFDGREALARITAPTRILVGSQDYATPPAMAEALHAAIPQSFLQVLDGAAHLTPMEQPEAVAAALRTLMAA
jgi:3-oxoadipate enol-lactonase